MNNLNIGSKTYRVSIEHDKHRKIGFGFLALYDNNHIEIFCRFEIEKRNIVLTLDSFRDYNAQISHEVYIKSIQEYIKNNKEFIFEEYLKISKKYFQEKNKESVLKIYKDNLDLLNFEKTLFELRD